MTKYVFAVGDIHVGYHQMGRAPSWAENLAKGGTVAFLGDYIDRGPECAHVVQRLIDGPLMIHQIHSKEPF